MPPEAEVTEAEADDLRQENARLRDINRRLREELITLENERPAPPGDPVAPPAPTPEPDDPPPAARPSMMIDAQSITGRLATLLAFGFFDGGKTIDEAARELVRHAWPVGFPSLNPTPRAIHAALEALAREGFVTRQGHHYSRVADAVIRVA